jgi:RHH-type transcriptional regulator, rel operon repressor / antitoxin RelB
MLAINIEPGLEARLDELSSKTGRTKDSFVEEAVRVLLEDMDDARMADEVSARSEPTVTLEEVRRELGLDN